ncbi:hypothetical protein [Chitinophaga solisilvae]|uniref:Uncharacterized protein n=1 Tax=Chitinophaga solisilvae TaxID=1233460 RepID=A0A9Q5D0K9_9BACT|nr:hypothetical protein [Chitinophaga solisilvae]NSL87616.1 hypothetical protein [Chitinophaga solisilvae]
MKRLLSILLLCITLLQSTGNCWIVAAFYLNRNHIAETLCINRFDRIPVCRGACFLDSQLSQQERREEKAPDIKYKEMTLFCVHIADLPEQSLPGKNISSLQLYKSPYFPHLYTQQVFKPPVQLA